MIPIGCWNITHFVTLHLIGCHHIIHFATMFFIGCHISMHSWNVKWCHGIVLEKTKMITISTLVWWNSFDSNARL